MLEVRIRTKHFVWCKVINSDFKEMAKACGIYECLWSPAYFNMHTAGAVAPEVTRALRDLLNSPGYYKLFETPYATYLAFRNFLVQYLSACVEYPDAELDNEELS